MNKLYLLFAIVFLPFTTFCQGHILGNFPSIDGGFENQPSSGTTNTGATPFSGTQANYTDNNAGTTATFKSSGGRSGAQYLEVTTLASGQGFYTPTANLAQNTSYIVQYYFRYNGASNRSMIVAASPDGGANFGANSTANNVNSISSWTKRTEVITSANTASNNFGIIRFNSSGGVISTVFDIDDIVVYAGASADVTAPSAATSPVISNASSSSQNLSWTAPAGGVDGGGYVVVRYAASPAAADDPNQNGIYDVTSSVTGTVTGTVVYIGTATSFVSTGLTGGTTYYYKIYTVDKAFNYSSELTTNLATSCTGQWTGSVSTNWATAGNWCGSVVPTSSTDVVIPSTATQPTISSSVNCKSLTINSGATLTTSSAGTLNITGNIFNSGTMTNNGTTNFSGTSQQTFTGVSTFNNVIVNNTGGLLLGGVVTFNGNLTITAGTLNTNNNNFSLAGNLINNGGFTAGTSGITFTGATSTTITGSSTTVFNTITVNKGTDYNSVVDAQSVITMAAGGLTLTNGTLKISGSSTITPFTSDITSAPYRIPATSGLWVNGGTVSTTSNITSAGLVHVSSGTLNIGDAADEKFLPANGADIIIDGGILNVAGRLSYATSADIISFIMSAGTINAPTIGSTSTVAAFNIVNAGSSFTMSGGTIVINKSGGSTSNAGYYNIAGTSSVTGGTIQMGSASTPATDTMQINSTPPIWNLIINSNNSPVVKLANPLIINNDLTISGGKFLANNYDLTIGGNWINNATFTSGTNTVTFNGTTVMSGTTVSNTFDNLTVAASSSVTSSSGITGLVVNATLSTGASAVLDLGTTTLLSGTLSTISNTGTIKTGVPTTTSAVPLPSGKTWGGTIDYTSASVNQTVAGGTYNNLTVRPGNGKLASASGAVVVNGTLTVTTAFGGFDLGTNILSGTLTGISNSGDIKTSVPTSSSATPIPTGKTWGGTVYYNASAGAQTVVAGSYNILVNNNSSGTNTVSGDITVTNQFKTTAGGTLDLGSSYRLLNGGTITNNGTVKTSVPTSTSATPVPSGKTWGGTGTVDYAAATGAQTVVSGTYYNLKLSNTSGTSTETASATVNNNLTISASASLTINNAVVLTIKGSSLNSGTLINNGRIIMNGSSAQTFPGSTGTVSAMNEFEINNSAGVTIDNSFSISGKLLSTAGALDLANKNITLHSDTTNTAMVTQVGGSFAYSGGGKFIVERFISSLNDRAYRLLAAPVNTSATIKTNWQEGASNTVSGSQVNPSPNYGTEISGTGGSANGFDVTQTNQSSMYTFNQGTLAWQTITNTNVNTLNYLTGYLLYVRGDRSINLGSQSNPLPSTNTVLRSSGQLITGSVSYNSLANAGNFSLVTNPYASPVDWSLIYSGSATTNFENYYTYWDPNIGTRGGYVTVTNGNVTSPANAGAAPYGTKEIQSGQAFFVKTKPGITAPSLTISETHKSTTGNIEVFSPTALQERFNISLFFDNNGMRRIADGVSAIYRDDYSATLGDEDAQELNNWDENIALTRQGKNLSIEGRPTITGNDTLFLFINHMKQQNYEFVFDPQNFNHPDMIIELVDKYAAARTLLSSLNLTSINFSVTSDVASSAADRFCIIFSNATPLPVTLTGLKAKQQAANILVEWKVENEFNINQYEVERSVDGINFTKVASVAATSLATYNWLDRNPAAGNNYYRIKIVDVDGKLKYSGVVKVNNSTQKQSITILTNPIQDGVLSLSINNMPKGVYTLKVMNAAGQILMKRSINHEEGTSAETLLLNKNINTGTYFLEITKPDNSRISKKIFVQ